MEPRISAESSESLPTSRTAVGLGDDEVYEPVIERQRVLFVDDEPQVLEGVKDVLSKETFEVLTASSVHKALDILANHAVDIVVSDECMPDMSGSETPPVSRSRK